jgi:hypothetical protein
MLEELGLFTPQGIRYIDGRQTELLLKQGSTNHTRK